MKRNLHPGSLILLTSILFTVACKKSIDQVNTDPVGNIPADTTLTIPQVPYPMTVTPECDHAPFYGDSVIYPQPSTSGGDYLVAPQNNQGIQGKYLSWPAGLEMNPTTGVINLTRSETGQRY